MGGDLVQLLGSTWLMEAVWDGWMICCCAQSFFGSIIISFMSEIGIWYCSQADVADIVGVDRLH